MNEDCMKLAQLSKENCHVKGLHSLVLRPATNTSGMVRMYIAEPGIDLRGDLFGPTIAYHCHQYDIQITCISGVLINHVLTLKDRPADVTEAPVIQGWKFSSQLHGSATPMFSKTATMKMIAKLVITRLEPLDTYEGPSFEYHTVSIPPAGKEFVSWMVHEKPPTGIYDPTAYSNADLSGLTAEGLYGNMTQERYAALLKNAMSCMEPDAAALVSELSK